MSTEQKPTTLPALAVPSGSAFRGLEHIASSPLRQGEPFCPEIVAIARGALKEIESLRDELNRYRDAFLAERETRINLQAELEDYKY